MIRLCRFIILATDGLWDFVSPDEAVSEVGKLLEGRSDEDISKVQ
jgi:serine/threonine protein phosphatase PrpC